MKIPAGLWAGGFFCPDAPFFLPVLFTMFISLDKSVFFWK